VKINLVTRRSQCTHLFSQSVESKVWRLLRLENLGEEEEGDTEDATQGFWETHIEGSFMMDAILVFSVRDLQRKEDFFLINTVFLSC
jgi:hypothetical protein